MKSTKQSGLPAPITNEYSSKTIALNKEKKIRDYGEGERKDKIWKRFDAYVILLGIKEPLTEFELTAIYNFINTKFQDLGMNEIGEAIEMAVAGKLEVNPETYQSFNIPYLGRILTAYKKYKKEQVRQYEITQQTRLRKEEDNIHKKIFDKPEAELNQEYFDNAMEWTKKHKKLPYAWAWKEVYFHLRTTDEVNMNLEEIKEYLKNIKKRMRQERTQDKAGMSEFQRVSFDNKWDTNQSLKFNCRKAAVQDYLTKNCLT